MINHMPYILSSTRMTARNVKYDREDLEPFNVLLLPVLFAKGQLQCVPPMVPWIVDSPDAYSCNTCFPGNVPQ